MNPVQRGGLATVTAFDPCRPSVWREHDCLTAHATPCAVRCAQMMWTSLRRSRRYNVNRRRYVILNSERDIPLHHTESSYKSCQMGRQCNPPH